MPSALCGGVALVTGASRGIGAACAADLARHGAAVVVAARDTAACEAVASAIQDRGGRALAVACDVTDPGAVERAVEAAERAFGPVDILVNNAGRVDPVARLEHLSAEDFERTVRVNLHGAFHAVRAVLPGMKAAGTGRGTIVNVSSGAAHMPREGWTSYCVAKAGLLMLTRMLVHEEGEHVRVFGIQPGTVDTEMQAVIRRSGINPISRMSRTQHRPPEIPAGVIRYLCTPEAEDLRGRELSIGDDGLLARAGF